MQDMAPGPEKILYKPEKMKMPQPYKKAGG